MFQKNHPTSVLMIVNNINPNIMSEFEPHTRDICPVYVKKYVSGETSSIVFSYCVTVSRELNETGGIFVQNSFVSKMKLVYGYDLSVLKILKPSRLCWDKK